MFKFTSLALAITGSFFMATVESAQALNLSNKSFETGNFDGWENIGQATIQNSDFGVAPTDGIYQAVLETLDSELASEVTDLENFLFLSSGNLTSLNASEGSALKREITVNAGDILKFDWNFLTNENENETYNDFAFLSISSLETLADTFTPSIFSFSSLSKETGYQTYTYTFQNAGTYTLGLGVVDVGDNAVNSALLVDNFQLYTDSQSVPEPNGIFASIITLGFGFFHIKNKNKSRKI